METMESKESVDATRTEAKEEGETGGKAKGRTLKRMDVDWALVKRRWMSGEPAMQIASDMQIPYQTVYSHIRRSKWPKPKPKEVQQAMVPVVQKTVAQETKEAVQREVMAQAPAIAAETRKRLNEWFEAVLRNAGMLQRQIEDASARRCEVEEVKSLASSLEVVDRVARRTFGLDSPAGSAVSVFSVAAPVVSCPVIDVEPIPESTPTPSS